MKNVKDNEITASVVVIYIGVPHHSIESGMMERYDGAGLAMKATIVNHPLLHANYGNESKIWASPCPDILHDKPCRLP